MNENDQVLHHQLHAHFYTKNKKLSRKNANGLFLKYIDTENNKETFIDVNETNQNAEYPFVLSATQYLAKEFGAGTLPTRKLNRLVKTFTQEICNIRYFLNQKGRAQYAWMTECDITIDYYPLDQHLTVWLDNFRCKIQLWNHSVTREA